MRRSFFSLLAAAAIGLVALSPALAGSAQQKVDQAAGKGADSDARLRDVLKTKLGWTPSDIEPAPMPGWFTVFNAGKVYYVDAAGKLLIDGHLVDIDSKSSITAKRQSEFEARSEPVMNVSKLRLEDAIEVKRGSDKRRVLYTFEDPNCGYCKRLAPELRKLQGVTIYTLPISILGPASAQMNKALWCSKDRSSAWAAVMGGDQLASPARGESCDTSALDRNMALAASLSVLGTPTMFFRDGSRLKGAASMEMIEKMISEKARQ